MPQKPLHPCGRPGCPELTRERFCPKHQAEANKTYDQYQRDKTLKSFYNSLPWTTLRALKLKQDPFCEECRKSGTLVKATMVDHIHEIKDGGRALDINNLQSLCHSCHSRKTLQERNRRGHQISTT